MFTRNLSRIKSQRHSVTDSSTEAPPSSVGGCSVHTIEEGEGTSIQAMGYYDIMILGLTGQGKTTTAEKLLIANPTGEDNRMYEGPRVDISRQQLLLEDLSAWLIPSDQSSLERILTRMKNLTFYRSLKNPHKCINDAHESDMYVNQRTVCCELFSNETTKVRVLDVPGFFGASIGSDCNHQDIWSNARETQLRDVLSLYIQAAMAMKFKRVLYFLPCRDTLQMSSATLLHELQLLKYYFGRSIFRSMVLVATLGPTIYNLVPEGVPVRMPNLELERSRTVFRETLRSLLPENTPSPPIIFISQRESCESILEKVQDTEVALDGLQLELNSFICARCSMTVGELNGERIACTTDGDWSKSILYEDSSCHPPFVAKYTFLQKILYTVKSALIEDPKFPDLNARVCPVCNKLPGTKGCIKIGRCCEDRIVEHVKETETHRSLLQKGKKRRGILFSPPSLSHSGRSSRALITSSGYSAAGEEGWVGNVSDSSGGVVREQKVQVEIEPSSSPPALSPQGIYSIQ